MLDVSSIPNKLSDDASRITLNTTVDVAKIQADIAKKMGGIKQNSFVQNPIYNAQSYSMAYPNAPVQPYQVYPQYAYNYNWQQPAPQNAYADNSAYNAQYNQLPEQPQTTQAQAF